VKKILEEKYDYFLSNLSRLRNKLEMGVKIYFDDLTVREQAKNDPEIAGMEKDAASKTPGQAYFIKQKIQSL